MINRKWFWKSNRDWLAIELAQQERVVSACQRDLDGALRRVTRIREEMLALDKEHAPTASDIGAAIGWPQA